IGPDPNRKDIAWSQIDRFFVVVKRPLPGTGGGNGQFTIDHLQAGRAADWPRQKTFEAVRPDTAAAAKAARYFLHPDRQKNTGLFVSWKEEPVPLAHLYDQALVLIVLTREGIWNAGTPINTAAQKANRLVDFLTLIQKVDGHWARTWNPATGQELADDQWVGDQAWWIMALMEYARKSGDETAFASAQKGGDWLAAQIDLSGRVVPSTEGTVDTWWAMIATHRLNLADKIQNYLLTQVWDADLKYWWRGRGDNPDPFIAMDCATWVGEFAKSPRVNKPEMTRAALSFVRSTLVTTDDNGSRCGFDGMGPVSVWCEGTAQYVTAGGEGAQTFLDMLLSIQRADGGMPGSPNNWSSDCYGWLSDWTGLAPTAWLYFALTKSPFPIDLATSVVGEKKQVPSSFLLQQNYPNPFLSGAKSRAAGNPSTRIEYFLPQADHVIVKVYDLAGRAVAALVDQPQAAGWHRVVFDGDGLADGIYFYQLQVGRTTQTKKLLLLQ
ncbi:MAG: T9SS type A sorting domain-containing protein, partial [bacterium]